MRVRTRRFEKLRSCESWEAKFVEVSDREDTVQSSLAVTPPATGSSGNEGCQIMRRTEASESAVHRGSNTPVFELDSPESVTNPRVKIFERLGRLCQSEVRLPPRQVFPHLLGNLSHAFATDPLGDGFNALLERLQSLGSNRRFDCVT